MENEGEIVGGHFFDQGSSKPVLFRPFRHCFQIPHPPSWVLLAKTAVERLIGWRRMLPVAAVWAVQIKHTIGRQQTRCAPHKPNRGFPRRDVNHVDADNRIRPLNGPRVCRGVESEGRQDIAHAG